MESKYSLAILGLGVMGRSLATNFERNGFPVIGYDVAPRLPDDFKVKVTNSLEELAGVRIDIISTGPERDHTILLRNPFSAQE